MKVRARSVYVGVMSILGSGHEVHDKKLRDFQKEAPKTSVLNGIVPPSFSLVKTSDWDAKRRNRQQEVSNFRLPLLLSLSSLSSFRYAVLTPA